MTSGTLWEIVDGVRRAKAFQLAGSHLIRAIPQDPDGTIGPEMDVLIEDLRSPHKLISNRSANMVRENNLAAALYAIHLILVKARAMIAEGAGTKRLYRLLDCCESLPSVIAREGEDTTEEFRSELLALGEEFPEFKGLVQNFDRNLSWR